MMSTLKVSIITLTYKNWHLLGKAIASVVSQNVDINYTLEYLIVDDGTEGFDPRFFINILNETGLDYKIIKNSCNVGTVASFNNAIQHSNGDIIIPLSADDEFYDSNVVNNIVNEFVGTDSDIITCLRVPVKNGVEKSSLPKEKHFSLFNNSNLLLKRILVFGNIISGASTYYRRDVFNKVDLFDTDYRLLEDYPFYIKSLSLGVKISLLKIKAVNYGVDGVTGSGCINSIIKNDFNNLYRVILNRSDINWLERRVIMYLKLMSREDRRRCPWREIDVFIVKLILNVRLKYSRAYDFFCKK
ncbi:glycosyltransferase [Shewanella glacialipiscicola]|uniref:glycosyltransferase n=1 Tax=Shewanella glacialipiscicola TaxID=614069 RepID=UPI003D78F091